MLSLIFKYRVTNHPSKRWASFITLQFALLTLILLYPFCSSNLSFSNLIILGNHFIQNCAISLKFAQTGMPVFGIPQMLFTCAKREVFAIYQSTKYNQNALLFPFSLLKNLPFFSILKVSSVCHTCNGS